MTACKANNNTCEKQAVLICNVGWVWKPKGDIGNVLKLMAGQLKEIYLPQKKIILPSLLLSTQLTPVKGAQANTTNNVKRPTRKKEMGLCKCHSFPYLAGYIRSLLECTLDMCTQYKTYKEALEATKGPAPPPPTTAGRDRPSLDVIRTMQRTRFNK